MDDVLIEREAEGLIEAARSRTYSDGRPYRHAVRDTLILRVMLECGLRVSEVVQLERDAVFAGATSIVVGVNKKRRHVPAPPDLTASLEEFIENGHLNGFLHVGPRQPGTVFNVSADAIERIVKYYARAAGIVRDVRPFTLRRTFAQRMFPAELATLEDLARVLGLASTESAARYLDSDIVGGASAAV